MNLTAARRYRADEKAELLRVVARAKELCPERSTIEILKDLGLPRATYYDWQGRERAGQLANQVVVPRRGALPPTPTEVSITKRFAEAHPELGYKRLSYALMAENQAFLREWMVYDILGAADLLGRRAPKPEALQRPPEADHPDQRWHTDLMMWHFSGRWFWLSDVLDAYSRYLVHCEVLLSATDEAVILATQRALETLGQRPRADGEPQVVHDGGPQFISHEWCQFVQATHLTDVRTHPYHPQSNGRDERWHRTLREELPLGEEATLYRARELITTYRTYYNERRPHSALHYLCPLDYYRGAPATRLVEREAKLRAAAEARRAYWAQHKCA